jgi:hypothetical protein
MAYTFGNPYLAKYSRIKTTKPLLYLPNPTFLEFSNHFHLIATQAMHFSFHEALETSD